VKLIKQLEIFFSKVITTENIGLGDGVAKLFCALDLNFVGPWFKHGAIPYNEAEVFTLSITNPNGRPMLPFDWLIHPSLILAS